jgi:signal transduction histidine kinase
MIFFFSNAIFDAPCTAFLSCLFASIVLATCRAFTPKILYKNAFLIIWNALFLSFFTLPVQAQFSLPSQPNSIPARIDSLTKTAETLRTRQPNKAREIAQTALQEAEQAEYSVGQIQALTVLGYVEWVQGLNEQSLTTTLRAVRLNQEQSHTTPDDSARRRQYCVLLRQIGNVYASERNFAKADEYYRQGYALANQIQDIEHIVMFLNNIGAIFYYTNSLDSAHSYYQRALMLCSTVEQSSVEQSSVEQSERFALTLLNLGQVSERLANYEEALYYCVRSLAISQRIGEKRYAGWSLLTIASVHRKQKRFIDAENALQTALYLADSLGSKELRRDVYEAESFLAEDTRQFDKALRFQRLFKEMNDSMFTEQGAVRMAALAAAHKDAEQRQEIELLHQTAQNQTFLRNTLLGGVLMLGVVCAVVWNRYRLKRASEEALQEKNREILHQQEHLQQQAEEISRFNQEITQFNMEISQRNELLQAANREKTELMGIVAHDLKNPLAAIQGMAAVLTIEQSWNTYSDQAARQIVSTSQRMFELIEQLLNVNALESGKVLLQPQALDAVSIVGAVVEQLRASAEKKSITLHLKTSRDAVLVQADRNALVQIAENLISNAIKYSPHGKNVVVGVLESDATNGVDTLLRIEVKDEGPGISDKDKKKLFGKFVRLSAQPTGGEHSTGLGLSIVKKLVEAMQGRVWCESAQGEGATFVVELPQV